MDHDPGNPRGSWEIAALAEAGLSELSSLQLPISTHRHRYNCAVSLSCHLLGSFPVAASRKTTTTVPASRHRVPGSQTDLASSDVVHQEVDGRVDVVETDDDGVDRLAMSRGVLNGRWPVR